MSDGKYPLEDTDSLGVIPLGSGSDFAVFLQHIGVRISVIG